MKTPIKTLPLLIGLLAMLAAPAFATVTVVSFTSLPKSPQRIGESITWTATATDTSAGPLTFQFNVTPPNGTSTMVKDFNVGTLSSSTWTSPSFAWVPTGIEGTYELQVVVKDFATGDSASKTVKFQVLPIVTGSTPMVKKTANPLVALFSAPSCAAGSVMRVSFQETGSTSAPYLTNWVSCHPPNTMTFEVAGLYPKTSYTMLAQTDNGTTITNGSSLTFTTGALPKSIGFPKFSVKTTATDPDYPVILHNPIALGGDTTVYPDVATDLSGRIIWYYEPDDATKSDVLTRPLPGGGTITIQDDVAWNPKATQEQFLRQIDLAGNIVRETNMGVIQQELVALGSVDGGPCTAITTATIGAACAGSFHHDAIQTLPNGWTAALIDIEKIFPAGTQGDTQTGCGACLVDIIGDMIVVLDTNWQVQWYFDSFDPAGGGNGYPLMPVSSPPLPWAGPCGASTAGCPPVFLVSLSGVAPLAHDWLHANSLYYWPAPQDGNTTGGDIIWSSRHQNWFFRIDYRDMAGTGDILWRCGPPNPLTGLSGNFTITNPYNDPYAWWSGQHDVGIQNGGAQPVTLFDNGDSRVSDASLGLGGLGPCPNAHAPYDCDSRGMAFTITQPVGDCAVSCTPGLVTQDVSFDLGGYSVAMGSAELLPNGNYFFENPIVFNTKTLVTNGFSMEIAPTPAFPQVGPADILMDVVGPEHYRGWQMISLYSPPTT